jgi:serine/threonine-protein kinase
VLDRRPDAALSQSVPGLAGPGDSGRSGGKGGTGTVIEVRILSGARSGEQMYFFDAQKVRIGRNLASDVVLPDPGVSRQHAELVREGSGYVLRDVGSTAGTYLLPSGERLGAHTLEPFREPVVEPPGRSGAQAVGGPASGKASKPPPPISIDVSVGPIGQAPRCRIGVGLSVPFGRYVLTGRLGGGGMAEVFMARQTGLGGLFRPVALKLIQPEMWSLIDAGAMFLDEARIAADINHHNVVKIYDVGEHEGVLFLAMEYLRGVTVSNLTAQLLQRGERMPPDLVAALISQACAGLHAAHQLRDMSGRLLNVVHRDVSPSNLMVLPEGLVKVIDFGVARADTRLHKAEEGLQGKPAYMSPEQVQAQPLDCRSDVFALGVVLYELCAGQPLFYREDTVATFYAVVRGEVPPLRQVCPTASPRLEAIVQRALAKLPDQRFQSAAELAAELDLVVAEAGGRFSSIAMISRYLTERGVHLLGAPPALLTQVPKAMYAETGRHPKAPARELFDSHDAPLPEAAPNQAAPAREATPLLPTPSRPPLASPPLSRPPPSRPVAPGSSGLQAAVAPRKSQRPLTSEPQRLLGTVLAGRYRLQRCLGAAPGIDQPLVKLTYQATLLTDGASETAARKAGRLRGDQVVVAVCGRGEHVQPLHPEQQAHLMRFAAQRALPAVPPALLPVLCCDPVTLDGEPDGDGHGATFIVQPLVGDSLRTYGERVALDLAATLALARALVKTLAQALQYDPAFVHGDLKPDRIGLWPPLPPSGAATVKSQPVLLGFSLAAVLADAAVRPPLPGAGSGSLYLAPERWAGAPPTAAADVFALAAILYELLGGDLARAAQHARHRREIPPLPPQPGLLPHHLLAIQSALRVDEAQRPDAARLLELLGPPESTAAPPPSEPAAGVAPSTEPQAAPPGYQKVALPAFGEQQSLVTPSGRSIVLLAMSVPVGRDHATLPLPLSAVPGLLSAPLLLIAHGQSLMVEIDGTPLGRGRDRPGLYHDAQDPSTRCERYTLRPTTEQAFFDLGHRRLSVQRLYYASVLCEKAPGPLSVQLPELRLLIAAPGALQRLVVLYTEQREVTYALCIAVG